MTEEKRLTGYPSIDKPWLKYYSEDVKTADGTDLDEMTLYDYIYINNYKSPKDIALRYFGNKITYDELFLMIENAERKLTTLDIKSGDVVAFLSITTPELIAIFYAINKIGAVSCMLDPRKPADILIKNMVEANVTTLFILDECSDALDIIVEKCCLKNIVVLSAENHMGWGIKVLYKMKSNKKTTSSSVSLWEKVIPQKSVLKVKKTSSDKKIAMICYTGGTTGESKGVLLTDLNINSIVEQFRKATNGFERQQKWLTSAVPFVAYVMVCGMHMPLSFGMDCYIELYNVEKMVKKVLKHHINHFAATPMFYEKLYDLAKGKDLSFVIMPTTGADKLNQKTYEKVNELFREHGCDWKLCNGYGMTEVSSGACVCINNDCNKAGSVGIPLVDTIVTAFTADGKECKFNELGEICISGPGLMFGYLGDSNLTDNVIKVHNGRRWMHTGDIGYVDEDGCVFIEGRIKRMIVRYDGFKIFPANVEDKISKSTLVKQCSCVGITDHKNGTGQLPIVFIVPQNSEEKQELIENELYKLCDDVLLKYERPIKFVFLEYLPITRAGKVDYRELERKGENMCY